MASALRSALQSTIEESSLTYEQLIGYGAGGEVHRAKWKSESLGTVPVAAKKIPILEGSSAKIEIGNEVALFQQLDHPSIIKYYGHVVTNDHVVIVTEYAEKGSLYDYLKKTKSLSPELKSKWAIQGARGIKYLQENQVLHRDYKSPNLLITADDDLKICDFGISKNITSTKTTSSEKGTVKWLAPEAFTELQLSPTADIFAFGVVLWELETCQEPYPGISLMTLMYRVGEKGLRPEIPATCSPVLRDLMQRCWDGDRAKRPGIDEIIRQLQRCQDGDSTQSPNANEGKLQPATVESDCTAAALQTSNYLCKETHTRNNHCHQKCGHRPSVCALLLKFVTNHHEVYHRRKNAVHLPPSGIVPENSYTKYVLNNAIALSNACRNRECYLNLFNSQYTCGNYKSSSWTDANVEQYKRGEDRAGDAAKIQMQSGGGRSRESSAAIDSGIGTYVFGSSETRSSSQGTTAISLIGARHNEDSGVAGGQAYLKGLQNSELTHRRKPHRSSSSPNRQSPDTHKAAVGKQMCVESDKLVSVTKSPITNPEGNNERNHGGIQMSCRRMLKPMVIIIPVMIAIIYITIIASGVILSSTIQYHSSSASSLATLSWNPPLMNYISKVKGYIVEYKVLRDEEWKRLNKYLVPKPMCLVDGLITTGDYQVRITAVNVKGARQKTSGSSKPFRYRKGQWEEEKRIGEDEGPGYLKYAIGIALTPRNEIVVADRDNSGVSVYDTNGIHKMSIDTKQGLKPGQRSRPLEVAVNSKGMIFVTTNETTCSCVILYSKAGNYIRHFETGGKPSDTENGQLFGLTLDSDEHLLVGDTKHKCISKHTEDGSSIHYINVTIKPKHLAMTPKDDIIISNQRTVKVINQAGDVVHNLNKPDDVRYWVPKGVYCWHDIIFIANWSFEHDSAGIYCYSASSGDYLGIISTGTTSPLGVVLTDDANKMIVSQGKHGVTILQRK